MDNQKLTELFASIRTGDVEAFTVFYRAYKKPVFTVLWRIVASKEIAEDLTQDLFVKLFTDPPVPSVKNLRAYIFKMARNLALNAIRSQQYAQAEHTQAGAKDDFSGMELRLDLDSAIAKLSDSERQVLTLHLNADLTFSEIARVMELSLPAVYRIYKKALKTLRNALEGGSV